MENLFASRAIQDFYPAEEAVCYGCGRQNPHGLQIKSYWEGNEVVCRFRPHSHHQAYPGIVYGGLIACLIDCHSIAAAIADACRREEHDPATLPMVKYFTANLNVDFLRPTPLGVELLLRARITEVAGRKSRVACAVLAAGEETARGLVLAVRAA